jgi:hypothetical protein
MTEMGTDAPSNDTLGYPSDLTEFIKTLRVKPINEAPKPLLVYTPNPDPWAFLLKGMKRTTVKPNPDPYRELIQRLQDRETVDLYTERRQREKGETPKVDTEAIEAFRASEFVDLYTKRTLEQRAHRRP